MGFRGFLVEGSLGLRGLGASGGSRGPTSVESTIRPQEMAKDWLEANAKQAKQLAQAAYDRIPDKIQIENFGRPGGKVLRAVSARAGGLEMTLDAPVWISGARMKTAGWVFIRLGDVVTIHAAGAGAGEVFVVSLVAPANRHHHLNFRSRFV